MGRRRLSDVIATSGVGTTFALTWMLTWHIHGFAASNSNHHREERKRRDVVNLELASRLVDCFLASHPLLPLYAGAVALARREEEILAAWTSTTTTTRSRTFAFGRAAALRRRAAVRRLGGGDVGELHAALSRTRLVSEKNLRSRRRALCELDGVLRDALETFDAHPPRALYKAAGVFPPRGSACEMYERGYVWTRDDVDGRPERYILKSPTPRAVALGTGDGGGAWTRAWTRRVAERASAAATRARRWRLARSRWQPRATTRAERERCVLYTGPHTTPFARWTPILKDFARCISPPTPRFQSPSSTPFNAN